MSLTRKLHLTSPWLAALETAVFFCVLVPAWLLLAALAYRALPAAAGGRTESAPGGPLGWLGTLPVWMWMIQGAGVLLLLTLYWVPGEEETSRIELGGLVRFLVIAAGILVAWAQLTGGLVTDFLSTYWQALGG